MSILSQVPIWVWPLFVVLVVVGCRAMADRRVPVLVVYALPAFVGLALQSTGRLQPGVLGWTVFAMVWLGAVWGGYRLAAGWIVAREGRYLYLRGEKLTLLALMVIFFANFAVGTMTAVAPAMLSAPLSIALFAGCLAASSGQFAGRALRAMRT